jgi:hypothetical protein
MEVIKNNYTFNGEDITLDILYKIERIVTLLAEKENRSFDEAYANFLDSSTYRALQNTRSLLWAENTEFIVDEYYREKGTANSR